MEDNKLIDDVLIKKDHNALKEKKFKRANWFSVGVLLLGVLFKYLHLPGADILMLTAAVFIAIIGLIRFFQSPEKGIIEVAALVVSILLASWVFFTLFRLPFRAELQYLTIGAIILRGLFFRPRNDI